MYTRDGDENYTLYVHTCLKTGKVYVGITHKDASERWKDGEGYKTNFELYSDIRKYGWENGFFHQIVREDLSFEKAKEAESFFVDMYDSTNPEKGYNHNPGGDRCGRRRPKENFGDKIKALRVAKHMTQQQLADAIGITRSTVCKYELNRRTPVLSDLKRIADVFYVGLEYFGPEVPDEKGDVTFRLMNFFKDDRVGKEEKISLFNDILIAYSDIVLNSK